jgi:hypothetical protein
MGLFNMFSKKSSREDKMQEHAKSQMPPRAAQVAYASYRDNGEMFKAAQTLSKNDVQECYYAAFLLMSLKSYSEQTHQIMAIAAMGGHPSACARMGFLQPSIEEVWKDFCSVEDYRDAKAALVKLVGNY